MSDDAELTVAPTQDDPIARLASEVVGGPAGRRRGSARSWWTPIRVLLVFVFLTSGLAVLAKQHCRADGWQSADPDKYVHQCYSDIPLLYFGRGLNDGVFPYVDDVPADQQVEYPVLTGVIMGATSTFMLAVIPDDTNSVKQARWYFDINLLLLVVCFGITVIATARTVRRRPWDAAMVALAPGIALAGTINWDLWAVALTALGLMCWAKEKPAAAGVLLGLAVATKFYPLLILGPLFLLCLRAGRVRAGATTLGTAALAWLAVNVPVMILAREEWARFYSFSSERGASFGSIWYAGQLQNVPVLRNVEHLNSLASTLLVACCAGIALLILLARRRPRLAQVAFLVIAAFLLTNKVYSPQFVVWLIPLAAMARPRWRDFLIWQVCEVIHFVATWLYLVGQTLPADSAVRAPLGLDGYSIGVWIHVAGTMWLVALVVRDILYPEHDPVRADGSDDPGGGVLDGAVDTWDSGPRFESVDWAADGTSKPAGALETADR